MPGMDTAATGESACSGAAGLRDTAMLRLRKAIVLLQEDDGFAVLMCSWVEGHWWDVGCGMWDVRQAARQLSQRCGAREDGGTEKKLRARHQHSTPSTLHTLHAHARLQGPSATHSPTHPLTRRYRATPAGPAATTTTTAPTMADSQLYEDTFHITSLNSQKYDRVSRIAGTSSDSTVAMTLDVNTELYPIATGDDVQLLLASTLNLDGTKDEKGWREPRGESTLADMWDYVCYGKVYRLEEGQGENM